MNDNNLTDKEIAYLLGVAEAGIDKFWSEGSYEWSKENFSIVLHNRVDLEDVRIQTALRAWEKDGVIQFVGREDVYFRVLKPFPCSAALRATERVASWLAVRQRSAPPNSSLKQNRSSAQARFRDSA